MNLTPILTDAGLCPTQAAADATAYQQYERKHPAAASASSNSTLSQIAGPPTACRELEGPGRQVEQPVPPEAPDQLMQTGSPPISRVITMVLFALSCLGLLLFLWVSFGGTIPLAAQGYRVNVSFPNAQDLASQSDVRIAGVSVGKVVSTQLDPKGNRTHGHASDRQPVRPDPAGHRRRSCAPRRSWARPTSS